MLDASLLVIGDELLAGHVTDANSPWLAGRLRAHGVPLRRVIVVPDEPDAIGEALHAELARPGPRLVLTSGGVGSTPDDLTYEAVAAALGVGLAEDPVLAARIADAVAWSRAQDVEVTEEHVWHLGRMARVPAGARVLLAERRWAAAVAVDVDGGCEQGGATVVVLPGVPTEFRALVTEVLEPQLLAGRNPVPVTVEIEHPLPESALNPTFVRLLERFPDVRLGSYPGRPMLVRLTGLDAERVHGAEQLVREHLEVLLASPAGQRLASAWATRRPAPTAVDATEAAGAGAAAPSTSPTSSTSTSGRADP